MVSSVILVSLLFANAIWDFVSVTFGRIFRSSQFKIRDGHV